MCTSVSSPFQSSGSAPTISAFDIEGERRNSSSAHLRLRNGSDSVSPEKNRSPLTDAPVGGNGEAAEGSQEEEQRESGGERSFHFSSASILEC